MFPRVVEAQIVDPDNVPETLCLGTINAHIAPGKLIVLTCTHPRPKIAALVDKGEFELENVVRARIVVNLDTVVALRDLLSRLVVISASAPSGFGAVRPN